MGSHRESKCGLAHDLIVASINWKPGWLKFIMSRSARSLRSSSSMALARAGLTQHERIHEDSRKRKRHRKSGKRIVVLVALGLWSDGSHKRHILDWEGAEKEEKAAWERLVQRLWERGVKLETGLQAIGREGSEGLEQALDSVYGSALLQQRCIFHKVRNVSDKCVGLDRQGNKSRLPQAAAVYQATSAPEAQAQLATFGEQWRPTQPQAVATFEREFEQTIRSSS